MPAYFASARMVSIGFTPMQLGKTAGVAHEQVLESVHTERIVDDAEFGIFGPRIAALRVRAPERKLARVADEVVDARAFGRAFERG